MRALWIVGAIVGCGTPPPPPSRFGEPSPVAVGSTATVRASNSDCEHRGCDEIEVSASVDDPTAFKIEVREHVVHYTSLRHSIAKLTVMTDNGGETDRFERTLFGLTPNRVKLAIGCPHVAYRVSTKVEATFELWGSHIGLDKKLVHRADYHPIESNAMTITSAPSMGKVTFTMAATPMTGTITSPVDTQLAVPVTLHDRASVTGIVLTPVPGQMPQVGGTGAFLGNQLLPGDTTPCDPYPMTARVLTPDVCKLADGTATGATVDSKVTLRFNAAGTCTFEVALDGTSHVAQRSLTIP